MSEQINLDSWDNFQGEWLKASQIEAWPLKLVVSNIEGKIIDGKPRLWIETEYPQGTKRKLNINNTNRKFIQERMIPREVIGKILVFGKCRVTDPIKKTTVDSFELINIEDKE